MYLLRSGWERFPPRLGTIGGDWVTRDDVQSDAAEGFEFAPFLWRGSSHAGLLTDGSVSIRGRVSPVDFVDSWSRGRRSAPRGVLTTECKTSTGVSPESSSWLEPHSPLTDDAKPVRPHFKHIDYRSALLGNGVHGEKQKLVSVDARAVCCIINCFPLLPLNQKGVSIT